MTICDFPAFDENDNDSPCPNIAVYRVHIEGEPAEDWSNACSVCAALLADICDQQEALQQPEGAPWDTEQARALGYAKAAARWAHR